MVLEQNRLKLYVWWILEAIVLIEKYIEWFDFDAFEKNRDKVDACLMQLIHIWETANNIRKKYPTFDKIPYDFVVGLRNFIAHDYIGVRRIRIWNTIKKDLPELRKKLSEYLKS